MTKETVRNNVLPLLQYYYCSVRNEKNIDYSAKNVIITGNTIDYLFDCGLSTIEIAKELSKHKETAVDYDSLSPSLWNGSLIKKGAFYLHNSLRLSSPAPVYDFVKNETIEYPYYCEMKIRFTEDDVLDFFYSRLNFINKTLADREYDRRALRSLLKKYSVFDYVEPLDIILCSIINHLKQAEDCYRLIDITQTNKQVIELLLSDMLALNMKDERKMVARRKCLT